MAADGQLLPTGPSSVEPVAPSGVAGGDLGGTYPSPTVLSLANVTNGSMAVPLTRSATAVTFNYYVATTGSDSNNGTSALTPFLTIQKALDKSMGVFSGTIQINIADGTYAENLFVPPTMNSTKDTAIVFNNFIDIVGNETTPANVVISPASSSAVRGWNTNFRLRGVRLSGGATSTAISAVDSRILLKNMDFNGVATFFNASRCVVQYEASTAGGTWTAGASNGVLLSMSFGTSFTTSTSALTLVAGAATQQMVLAATGSRVTTGGSLTLTGTAGVTLLGLGASTFGSYSLGGTSTVTITGITGTPTAGNYEAGAIRIISNSSFFAASTVTFSFNTCTNAFFLNKCSSIETNGNVTTTYTTVTNKLKLDHTCTVDSPDYFDFTSTDYVYGTARTIGDVNNTDAFLAGTAVASANNLVLSNNGNILHVTGTTQINLINNQNLFYPYYVLIFDGACTVKNNQGASGNNKPILLAGSADFVSAANGRLTLIYDATNSVWMETARTIA